MTSTEWETMMREALTDEGWAEVTADIPEVNFVDVDELAMCERCAALIWPGYRGNHAAWHRQLTIAIKAQGLLQSRMLTLLMEAAGQSQTVEFFLCPQCGKNLLNADPLPDGGLRCSCGHIFIHMTGPSIDFGFTSGPAS